ncbi:MAG: CocE/NonD family hydrolase [Planctomycetota bacterium]
MKRTLSRAAAATAGEAMAMDAPDISAEVAMRDGVDLPLRAWVPAGDGPWPVVVVRWYNTTPPGHLGPATFLAGGYAFAVQAFRDGTGDDIRGEPGSRFTRDDLDGYDTVEWIARQPWCDGSVAMTGKSAGGITAWQAATARPPHLKAIIPQNCGGTFGTWGVWGYRANGAVTLAMTANGRAVPDIRQPPWDRSRDAYMALPLIDLDVRATGGQSPLWRTYVTEDRWEPDESYKDVDVPVLLVGGWWDYYAGAAFELWGALRRNRPDNDVRVIVDATQHISEFPPDGRDYGDGVTDVPAASVRWLDGVLSGRGRAADAGAVRVFTMGTNRWRQYDDWPPSDATVTEVYLRSADGGRVGALDPAAPNAEPPSAYVYDPDDPVPTLGGNHSIWYDHPLVPVGSFDHTPHKRRADVLVFSTDVLDADTEVTGPVTVRLWAASDAPDTDWAAILLDVGPDGRPFNVTMGILRARYRHGMYRPPSPLTPGAIEPYTLHLMPTSYVFKRGHRIRLHISSSNFPLWDRNTNTGGDIATETRTQPACQRIYHDRAHPSCLCLPIVAGGVPAP